MAAINWSDKNQTTANADNFQIIFLQWSSTGDFMFIVGCHATPLNNTLKMLGITLDDKLNFKTHIRKKAISTNQWTHAFPNF